MPSHEIFAVGGEPPSDLETLYHRWMDARDATTTLMAGMRLGFAAQDAIYGNIKENLHTFFELYLRGPEELKPRQHSL